MMTNKQTTNESYELAEKWVCDQLSLNAEPQIGDEFDVNDMNKCDCIPVVIYGAISQWDLVGVVVKNRALVATYKLG